MRRAAALVGLLAACRAAPAEWLKGQTHCHSSNSGDSKTSPDEVARWYAAHGFDFIVFTDHDHVTSHDPLTNSAGQPMLALPGVELTQNLEECEPPAVPRDWCPLHVNALFVATPRGERIVWPPGGTRSRLERYQRALDVTRELGGVAQLNHPNFHYGADAPLIAELARRGLALLEVANQQRDVNNPGDAGHPSTEQLWDAVLTAGPTVWGVASDDAHHYPGDFPPGLGWIMVRARRDPQAIREAVAAGRFYASTGVVLERAEVEAGDLVVQVSSSPGENRIIFIGSGGRKLAEAHADQARFPVPAEGYVRADVVDAAGRRAWVQPARAH